jgi:16S rRNA (cytosine1402-N4)-methyltransferase
MVDEVVALLGPVPAGVVVDATVGGGGHSAALLEAHPDLSVVGIDQDPDAVAAAAARLARFGDRATVLHGRFDDLPGALGRAGVPTGGLSGVLFDLGVSSPQLDRADRGFSYRLDGPLDMRMDRSGQGVTAADLVNTATVADLVTILRSNADERFARRIAEAIVAARPITGTARLAEVVRDAIPAATRRTGGHPATRAFQALRIAVNAELDLLAPALRTAIELLAPGGRLVVITYHSGEDRIAKEVLREAEHGGPPPPRGLPLPAGQTPLVRLLARGGMVPSAAEVVANPRARSARIRVAERLATGG